MAWRLGEEFLCTWHRCPQVRVDWIHRSSSYLKQQGVVVGQVQLKDQAYSSTDLREDKQGFSPFFLSRCQFSVWHVFPLHVVRVSPTPPTFGTALCPLLLPDNNWQPFSRPKKGPERPPPPVIVPGAVPAFSQELLFLTLVSCRKGEAWWGAVQGKGSPHNLWKTIAWMSLLWLAGFFFFFFLLMLWKSCLLIAFDFKCKGKWKGTWLSVLVVGEQSYRKTNIQALRGNLWPVQEPNTSPNSPVAALTTRMLSFYGYSLNIQS